ncbi:MAG: ArsR family transcriptional regulator [Archaeoglobus sp.]|uniref:ArsR family transcriptional regulator n=1 Tax=Archaeoglobus sp. TaxID=1872626 RepID=UPI001D2FF47A|nr:ArsR family transcriptional regulator [Archaeoglobus sp.]MBO8180078.1 ArsR family transcriptional regulator [Archaeoglobus sp.]
MNFPELMDEILLILSEKEMTERELAKILRVERKILKKVLEFLKEMDFIESDNLRLRLSESGRKLVELDVY